MECADRNALRIVARMLAHALAHFLGRLVRERHCDNAAGIDFRLLDEMCNAVDQSARFAGTGAGEDEERAFGVLDGVALLGVEIVWVRHGYQYGFLGYRLEGRERINSNSISNSISN